MPTPERLIGEPRVFGLPEGPALESSLTPRLESLERHDHPAQTALLYQTVDYSLAHDASMRLWARPADEHWPELHLLTQMEPDERDVILRARPPRRGMTPRPAVATPRERRPVSHRPRAVATVGTAGHWRRSGLPRRRRLPDLGRRASDRVRGQHPTQRETRRTRGCATPCAVPSAASARAAVPGPAFTSKRARPISRVLSPGARERVGLCVTGCGACQPPPASLTDGAFILGRRLVRPINEPSGDGGSRSSQLPGRLQFPWPNAITTRVPPQPQRLRSSGRHCGREHHAGAIPKALVRARRRSDTFGGSAEA